jgi:bifunctional DNA-binding transcriptional regulator/antitoxin component of YhaV-PrlF toxin-antitoxin module
MSGKQNTTAMAVQKERLVAAFRPATVLAPSSVSPTLLSQLRPLSLSPTTKWTHGFSRLDGSGRVRDAFLFRELGWSSGDRLLSTIDCSRLIIRRDTSGNTNLDPRGRVTLGEAARRVLHLEDGDGVLLSADLAEGFLVIHPAQRCDEVLNV